MEKFRVPQRWLVMLTTILIIAGVAGLAYANTITVAAGAVVVDGDGNDGLCSLGEAIINANDDAQTNQDCPAGSGADTLELATGATYTLTIVYNTLNGQNGLPSITSEITINGNGAIVERSAVLTCNLNGTPSGREFRIFHVGSSGQLTLNNLTVHNGCADGTLGGGLFNLGVTTVSNSTFSNNSAFKGGAMASVGGSTLTVIQITFSNNAAACSPSGCVANGGAIVNSSSTVLISESNFSAHTAQDLGGALSNEGSGNLMVSTSTFSNNQVFNGFGGALHNDASATAIVSGSTISANSALRGGGLHNLGTLTLNNTTVSNNSTIGSGGGLYNESGATATINSSTFSGNAATCSIFPCGSSAGGILNKGTLEIHDSTISENTTFNNGGGILNTNTLTILNSSFLRNSANSSACPPGGCQGFGGGIYNDTAGMVTVSGSTFSENVGSIWGGGILNSGRVTVSQSTFSKNSSGAGGGIANTVHSTVTVLDSTFSANSANFGGGLSNDIFGTVTISFSTFSGNSGFAAGGGVYNARLTRSSFIQMNIKNTIIANSPTGDNCSIQTSGTLTASGVNFSTDASCEGFTQVSSNQLNLGPLQLNAPGTTETHALLEGSVAIDAMSDCIDVDGNSVSADQRGVARPQNGQCDVGAFEVEEIQPPAAQITGDLNGDGVVDQADLQRLDQAIAGTNPLTAEEFARADVASKCGVNSSKELKKDRAAIAKFVQKNRQVADKCHPGKLVGQPINEGLAVVPTSLSEKDRATSEWERIEIYNLCGHVQIETEWMTRSMSRAMEREIGRALANGVYLYVVSARDKDGKLVRAELRKLVVQR